MNTYGIWFEGRRTPVVVQSGNRSQAIVKAREYKVRGGDLVEVARLLSESELKVIESGGWLRTGPDGQPAGYNPNKKGQGPEPQARKD
jgi:hypothetical protein